MNIRNTIFAFSLLVLSGCASKSVDRFPDLTSDFSSIRSVNVVADFVIFEDIAGKDLGVNLLKHEQAALDLKNELGAVLAENQITANFIHVGSGVFFDSEYPTLFNVVPEGSTFYYSDSYRSTGEEFLGYEAGGIWASAENIAALRSALESAKAYSPVLSEGQEKVAPLVFDDISQEFKGNDATHLLLLKSETIDVSAGKSIGVGLATGILTAVLSGGTYIASSSAVSQTENTVVLVDLKTNELVWTGNMLGGHSNQVGVASKNNLTQLLKEVDRRKKKAAKKK